MRIHRTPVLATIFVIGAFAGGLAILRHLVSGALSGSPLDQVCPGWVDPCVQDGVWWWERSQLLPVLIIALLALPALSGVLLGAMVSARDAERGTDILLRAQGVVPWRWWVADMCLVALPVAVLFVGLGLLARSTFNEAFPVMTAPMQTPGFEATGPVLGGYFLLAFGLAAAAGVWMRNTPAAITLGLVGSVALVLAVGTWLRPHYQQPLETTIAIAQSDGWSDQWPSSPDWILRDNYVGPQGQTLTAAEITCDGTSSAEWERCFEQQVVAQHFVWQPADRWLRFQLTELALLTVLGFAAAAAVLWRSRRSVR